MKIRKIEKEDLNDLQALYTQLCEEEGNLEKMRANFYQIRQNEDYYLIGAEVDGKIVGTLMGIVCHDLAGKYDAFMTIENVIVLESCRGKGIAKQLFQYIEERASERGCRYIYLVSGNKRVVAQDMYRSFGYDCDHVKGFKKFLEIQ